MTKTEGHNGTRDLPLAKSAVIGSDADGVQVVRGRPGLTMIGTYMTGLRGGVKSTQVFLTDEQRADLIRALGGIVPGATGEARGEQR